MQSTREGRVVLELECFEMPEELSVVNQTFTPSPKEFKVSVTG